MGMTLLTRSWRGPLPDALFLSLFLSNTTNLFFSRRGACAGWGMGMSNVWWACDTIRQFSNDQRRCAALSRSTQTRSRCRRADPSLSLSFPHLRFQVSLAHRGRRVVLQPPEGLLVREPEEGAGYYEGAGRQELYWRRVLRGARALSQGKQQKIHKIVIIIEAGFGWRVHARRIKSHFFYISQSTLQKQAELFS